MPNIITLNCACYSGGATVHAPVFQTGVQAHVDCRLPFSITGQMELPRFVIMR